jgi:hypothetical protein
MKPLPTAMLGVMFVLLTGCASGPSMASTGTAAVHSPEGAAASVVTGQHLTKVQRLVAKGRQEGLNGLYALVRGGHTMYCWRDRNVGTLIPSTKCVPDSATLRRVLGQMASMRHRLNEAPQGICASGGVCTGN